MTTLPHRWRFFRAGGFDQVQIDTPADLANLKHLDQKLWAALACPVADLEFDKRTLEYLDLDHDGRIRAPELLAAIDWTLSRLRDPGVLFRAEPLPLSALGEDEAGKLLAAASRHLLSIVGRAGDDKVSVADTDDLKRLFPANEANGDGLVPATFTDDESLKAVIADVIAVLGAETDRSGEPAVSEDKIKEFFTQAETVRAWKARGAETALQPFGDATAAALDAVAALREKIDDYFHRVALAAFDARAGALMNGEEAELVKLAARNLANVEETAGLPLADIGHGESLPLARGLNPAWAAAVATFRETVVVPLLGARESLSPEDWRLIKEKCAPCVAWQAEKPALAILGPIAEDRIEWLAGSDAQERLLALVAADRAVSGEADSLLDLDKLLRMQQYLVPLLNNFIALRDFYARRDKAVFQAGTLYIDGKSCDLVVRIGKIDDHARLASPSGSFLLYCECVRRTPDATGTRERMNIVAAVTAGDEGNLMVGRNGVFYDRQGRDWDAQVMKMVQNAISVREAFWLPYRRIGRMISEQVQKFAASRDQAVTAHAGDLVSKGAESTSSTLTAPPPAAPAAAAAAPAKAPFDIARFAGIFAAIGLALGAIGTAFAAVVGSFLALKWWQMPLALVGTMLLLSGPAMLLAWFKLRRRNLAPILDANGWAVNTQARLSIGFGTELTRIAALPEGAERSLRDPYAPKAPLWPWLLIVAVLLAGWWAFLHGWLSLGKH
ncbi:MAG TPA: hypothetical protein VFM34_04340 [Moraxellaceae bacterium]|nr:hypothetical protein [Moraxellaceae bacterium]